jgi:uncharacterized protein with HEPN domain
MPHNVRKLLLDIVISCEEVIEFHKEMSFEQYLQDRKLQLATERQFEIIGEAISRLDRVDPTGLSKNIPEFRQIIAFRNIIAHGYDVVDQAVLWDLAANKVPGLLEKVQNYRF